MKKLKNTSKAFYKTLDKFGVNTIFHLPGSVSVPLYEKIEKFNPVLMKNPVAVGYAADAYARIKGIGVALIAQGPGLAGILPTGYHTIMERSCSAYNNFRQAGIHGGRPSCMAVFSGRCNAREDHKSVHRYLGRR